MLPTVVVMLWVPVVIETETYTKINKKYVPTLLFFWQTSRAITHNHTNIAKICKKEKKDYT